jgi:hypothetical protein
LCDSLFRDTFSFQVGTEIRAAVFRAARMLLSVMPLRKHAPCMRQFAFYCSTLLQISLKARRDRRAMLCTPQTQSECSVCSRANKTQLHRIYDARPIGAGLPLTARFIIELALAHPGLAVTRSCKS